MTCCWDNGKDDLLHLDRLAERVVWERQRVTVRGNGCVGGWNRLAAVELSNEDLDDELAWKTQHPFVLKIRAPG